MQGMDGTRVKEHHCKITSAGHSYLQLSNPIKANKTKVSKFAGLDPKLIYYLLDLVIPFRIRCLILRVLL